MLVFIFSRIIVATFFAHKLHSGFCSTLCYRDTAIGINTDCVYRWGVDSGVARTTGTNKYTI